LTWSLKDDELPSFSFHEIQRHGFPAHISGNDDGGISIELLRPLVCHTHREDDETGESHYCMERLELSVKVSEVPAGGGTSLKLNVEAFCPHCPDICVPVDVTHSLPRSLLMFARPKRFDTLVTECKQLVCTNIECETPGLTQFWEKDNWNAMCKFGWGRIFCSTCGDRVGTASPESMML